MGQERSAVLLNRTLIVSIHLLGEFKVRRRCFTNGKAACRELQNCVPALTHQSIFKYINEDDEFLTLYIMPSPCLVQGLTAKGYIYNHEPYMMDSCIVQS